MKQWLIVLSEHAIVLIDFVAMIVIVLGTIEVLINGARTALASVSGHEQREVWIRYARWLVAGLTLQLGADIIETAITTSWDAVGRIAAIAIIRTFLNYFLERDLSEIRTRQREAPKA
ncbi:MAG TPA: DUF1622 domain-containing protein [Mesorhizobium sp.]|nr:DUF1622 domain-containing protein [Mesorhizobium sp.]